MEQKEKLRILVVEGWADSRAGGAENSMRSFVESTQSDYHFYLACTKVGDFVTDPLRGGVYQEFERFAFDNTTVTKLLSNLLDIIRLVRFIKTHKIDRIITHMVRVSPLLRVVQAFTGVPFSIYFKWVLTKENAGKKVKWGNGAVESAAAVSEFVRQWWIKNGIEANRISVVPEGIDVGEPIEQQTREMPEIGFAGRIVPEKGLNDLIKAMPDIQAIFPGAVLRIAGRFEDSRNGNQYEMQVRELIVKLGLEQTVRFEGFVSPLNEWLAERNLIVVPSTCDDAQPLVMMQAMGVGKVVVATAVGGIPEVLSNPFDKLLVPPGSPPDLASKVIERLLNVEESERLGMALREKCLIQYDRPVHISSLRRALNLDLQTTEETLSCPQVR